MLLIQNGLLHTMAGAGTAKGDILVEGGRILRVEKRMDPETMELERVIDAEGLHVCPGLIDAHIHLVRAAETLEADQQAMTDAALTSGVTTIALWPEEADAECVVRHGREKAKVQGGRTTCVATDEMSDEALRERMLHAARTGERIMSEAHGEDRVRRLVRMKKETGCELVLAHMTGGTELAEEIAESGCPVILGACSLRSRGSAYALAGRLRRMGVLVALTADYPATRLHHLPLCAGLCARAGMAREDALRAITLDAARLLGVDAVCGSIEPGKRADLTIYDGDPLMLATDRVMTISDGKIIGKA